MVDHIRFHTEVVWIEPVDDAKPGDRAPKWKVVSVAVDEDGNQQGERIFEEYDAVAICSGKFSLSSKLLFHPLFSAAKVTIGLLAGTALR